MRILMTILLLMGICSISYGQITHKYFFLKDGTIISGPLSNIVNQTHDYDSIYVLLASTATISIAHTDLDYYNYTGVPTSTRELETPSSPTFKIYPNPAQDILNVSYTLKQSDAISLGLYDINGREVLDKQQGTQSEGEYLESINLGDLPTGVYFLKLQGSSYQSTQKLIIRN